MYVCMYVCMYILYIYIFEIIMNTSSMHKLFVRLHGEYNTSLALWKHHVNYYCKAFDP